MTTGGGSDRGGLAVNSFLNDTNGPLIDFNRSRSNTIGTHNTLSSGDGIGGLIFRGSDGDEFVDAAAIVVETDGSTGNNDMPGRLTFSTAADGAAGVTERLRIDSGGRLLIGTAANQHNGGDLLQLAAESSTASLSLNRYTANAHPSYVNFFKSRMALIHLILHNHDQSLVHQFLHELCIK